MKRISLFIMIVMVTSITSVFAQKKAKPFTGEIKVSISYDGTWDAATLSQQPREFTISMGEKKQKSVFLAGGAQISTIVNTLDSSVTTLINAMGMKFFVKQTKDYIIETMSERAAPRINYLDETITIAGYDCKKAEYITLDEFEDEEITIVYYTPDLGNPAMNWGGQFHGLNGFPMKYSVKNDEGTITFEVTSLKKKKVKDTEFMIPTDYEEMSPEQLRALGG